MPMTSRSSYSTARALAFALCLGAAAATPACAAFGLGGPSLVAQGKYYSSGNPRYDEFFIQLYQLQLQMAEAPSIPESERQGLAQTLGLPADTAADGLNARLREEALKLEKVGVRLRLEQTPSLDKPEAASATVHASYRPKDEPSAALLAKVESAATNLLRTASGMKAAETQLGKLEVAVIGLQTDVPTAFAEAHVGTQSEVKQNLADAQKLITLMKARGGEVNDACEQLLSVIAKAINTDDGSLSAAPESAEPAKPDADGKKPPKSRAKPKAISAAPVTPAAPAAAAKPAPAKPAAAKSPPVSGDDEAPAKSAAPSKPAPPPRDFEP